VIGVVNRMLNSALNVFGAVVVAIGAVANTRAEGIDPVAVLTQIKGVVAVSKGQAFVQAHKVMLLSSGDSVLVLEGGEATVLYAGGCSERISSNMMLTLNPVETQCNEENAQAVEVGPLYAAAIGALPSAPVIHHKAKKSPKVNSHRPNSAASKSDTGQGAIGAFSTNGGDVKSVEHKPSASDVEPAVSMPPPITQLPPALPHKPSPDTAVVKSAPASSAPNGPVMVVPDVILDETDVSAAGNVSLSTRVPAASAPSVAPVAEPVTRTPTSQGGMEVSQALSMAEKDKAVDKSPEKIAEKIPEKERMRDKERESERNARPIAPLVERPVAAPAVVARPPAARTPVVKGAAPMLIESDEDSAAKRWRLGTDELDDMDGPRMFTGNE